MNNVTLIGRLTRDVECRYTGDQMAVATFSIAIDRPSKNGEKQADFPKITVFGKQAENCEKYIHKGSKVGIVGRLQTGSYKKQDGSTVYTTDVIANSVEFLDSREQQSNPSPQRKEYGEDNPSEQFQALNEDVPF